MQNNFSVKPGPGRYAMASAPPVEILSPIGNDIYKRQHNGFAMIPFGNNCFPSMEKNAVPVTQYSVLGIPPFWRATNILCGFLGRIPVELKRKRRGKKSTVETGDGRHFLMCKKPHANLRARTWKQTMGLHYQVAPSGAFSEIIRDPDTNEPEAILPLDPNRVAWGVEVDANNRPKRMIYLYIEQDFFGVPLGPPRIIDPANMLHFKGLSYDAVMGIDKIDLLQRKFGLMLARTEYQRKYYIGNARIRGFIMVPPGMQEVFGTMMEVISEHMAAQDMDPLKAIPLFDNAKFERADDTPEDQQLIEAMKTDPDTCGVITGVPGFLLGADTRDSYKSLEKVMSSFFTTTVHDQFNEFESEMDDKMLTEEELRTDELGFRFDRGELMATDVASFHTMLIEDLHGGLIAWEEAREAIDRHTDSSDGTFFVPQNIVGADPTDITGLSQGNGDDKATRKGTGVNCAKHPSGAVPAIDSRPRDAANNWVAVYNLTESTVRRVCERISNTAARASKSAEKFESFLDQLVEDSREPKLEQENLRPVYDIARGFGMLDHLPGTRVCNVFYDRLKATAEHLMTKDPDHFRKQVATICDDTSKELLVQIPELVTGHCGADDDKETDHGDDD